MHLELIIWRVWDERAQRDVNVIDVVFDEGSGIVVMNESPGFELIDNAVVSATRAVNDAMFSATESQCLFRLVT